jgi:hypothetical protein
MRGDALAQRKIKPTRAAETRTWIHDGDIDLICRAWEDYEGQIDVFESAVGALFVARLGGYDVLRLAHGSRTLRRYEKILKISFKQYTAERTDDSHRIIGIRRAEKFKQFWKAIAAGIGSEPGAKEVSSS